MKHGIAALTALMIALSLLAGCDSRDGNENEGPGEPDETSQSQNESGREEDPYQDLDREYTPSQAAEINKAIADSDVSLIQLEGPEKASEFAVLHTSEGDLVLALYRDQAPKAVENFVANAQKGFYTGLEFHFVSNNFMIRGGMPEDGYSSHYTDSEGNRIEATPEYSLDLWHFRGALSTVYGSDNPSEFAIVQAPTVSQEVLEEMEEINIPQKVVSAYERYGGLPGLDWKATVYGMVMEESLEVLDAIARKASGAGGTPSESVLIQSVSILEEYAL